MKRSRGGCRAAVAGLPTYLPLIGRGQRTIVGDVENVTAQEAKQLIDEGARLVDVRERYEWEEMRTDGELVPLSEYESNPELLGPAEKTIFICAHGNRSQVAAGIYESVHAGAKAYNLEGGIAAWVNAGLPTHFGPPE